MKLHLLGRVISPIILIALASAPLPALTQEYVEPAPTEEAAQTPATEPDENGAGETTEDATEETTETTTEETIETTTTEEATETTPPSPVNAIAPAPENVEVFLTSAEEVPSISSPARGTFSAVVDETAGTIVYKLSYEGLEANITQAHIHFGQRGANGGVVVTLCTNLTTTGPQACPQPPAAISGTILAANVEGGAAAQGIAAGEFAELIRAIRAGLTYVNVHSTKFPAGETRGQINDRQ